MRKKKEQSPLNFLRKGEIKMITYPRKLRIKATYKNPLAEKLKAKQAKLTSRSKKGLVSVSAQTLISNTD